MRSLRDRNRTSLRVPRGAKDEDGVAVEVPPGSVIFFDNRLLHKSTDNHSGRFRRCSVAHYISADSERLPYKNINHIKPVMWVRGGYILRKDGNRSIVTLCRSQKNRRINGHKYSTI